MKSLQRFVWPILLSLFIHFSIFDGIFNLLEKFAPKQGNDIFQKIPYPLKFRPISPKELEKYRTSIGVKGDKSKGQKKLKDLSDLALSSPSPIRRPKILKPKQSTSKSLTKNHQWLLQESESLKIGDDLKNETLGNLGLDRQSAYILKNSDFYVHFGPPEGIGKDKLNSVEKVYYSFNRRGTLNYLSSILKAYRRLLLKRPRIKQSLFESSHHLSGRIIFDSKGNILSVKIFQSSKNDDVHLLFEETLTRMEKLPNIPKDLLQENGQFTAYYQMTITNI